MKTHFPLWCIALTALVLAVSSSAPAQEETPDYFSCPESTVIGNPATPFDAEGYVPKYYPCEMSSVNEDIPFVAQIIELGQAEKICGVSFVGVEVDGDSNDCVLEDATFTVILLVVDNEKDDEPEGEDQLKFALFKTAAAEKQTIGTLTVDGKEVTAYRYVINDFGCQGVEAGTYAITIQHDPPANTKAEGCSFAWLNTLQGSDSLLDSTGMQLEDNVSFCLNRGFEKHPADTNKDARISENEAREALERWQEGDDYMTFSIRAQYISQKGDGAYTLNEDKEPPQSWEPAE